MPPADDPIALLNGRDAFVRMTNDLWSQSKEQGPVKGGCAWPMLANFEIDLYMLFEGVRGMGGRKSTTEEFQFPLLKDFLQIGDECNSYGTQFRNRYNQLLRPYEEEISSAIDNAYRRVNLYAEDRNFMRNRGVVFREKGQEPLGRTAVRRQRTGLKNGDLIGQPTEASIACLQAGFHPFMLSEDEKNHAVFSRFRASLAQVDLRAHILRMFYRNVGARLDVRDALRNIPHRYLHLGCIVFSYLELVGKINFGLVPKDAVFVRRSHRKQVQRHVAIVGAGIAGIIAARQLMRYGFDFTIFEARGRLGGRICTDFKTFGIPIELGGDVLYNPISNPCATVLKQSGLQLTSAKTGMILFGQDGAPTPRQHIQKARNTFLEVLDVMRDTFSETKHGLNKKSFGEALQQALERKAMVEGATEFKACMKSTPERCHDMVHVLRQSMISGAAHNSKTISPIVSWFAQNLERDCQCDLSMMSVSAWKHDGRRAGLGGDGMVAPSGLSELMGRLAVGLQDKVHCNREIEAVKIVDTGATGKSVSLSAAEVGDITGNFDAALMTIPLGVLKRRAVRFEPELPSNNVEALDSLACFSCVKVIMEFSMPFWGKDAWILGAIEDSRDHTRDYAAGVWAPKPKPRGLDRSAFTNFTRIQTRSGPERFILETYSNHAWLDVLEEIDDESIVRMAMAVLRRRWTLAQDPICHLVTRWNRDGLSLGIGSCPQLGSLPSKYQHIAAPIENTVFFAGEHTDQEAESAISAAFNSGCREAGNIMYKLGGWDFIFNLNLSRVPGLEYLAWVPQEAPEVFCPQPAETGAPTGAPMGTPTGAPVGTPTGAPMGAPTGAPIGAPTGAPQ